MNASRFAIGPLLIRSSRYLPLITGSAVLVVLLALTTTAHAQRPSFGGRSSGGRSSGGDSNDRREQMQSFFSRMREQQGGGDSNDRREQMQSFFSRMREQRGGDSGGDSRGGSRGGGREGSSRSRSSRQPQKPKPKPKPRITVDLPEQYASQDLDNDGQLGLYEWKLSAIAQFRSLDANSDGFLTPRELLVATPADSSTAAVSTDSATASASPASTTVSVSTTTAAQPTTAAASKKSAGAIRIAKFTFRALDKDKDGKITAEEWSKSSRTRAQFAKSKVTLKLPVDEAGFVAAYPARR
jgi:hypothetical protein